MSIIGEFMRIHLQKTVSVVRACVNNFSTDGREVTETILRLVSVRRRHPSKMPTDEIYLEDILKKILVLIFGGTS